MILAGALVIAGATVGASAQCQYSVKSTPNWQCAWGSTRTFTATGLNNLGAWCGYRGMCYPEEGEGQLPIYCPPNGMPQVLPMPPGAGAWGAQATGVNDAGVVVGFFSPAAIGTPNIGCIWWPDGTITVIPPVPGSEYSRATAVSNSNAVVGSSGALPYIWIDGVLQALAVPQGGALAISDTGHVTGAYSVGNLDLGFHWHEGVLTLLDPLSGYNKCAGLSVNNAGVVVGYSEKYLGPNLGYASMATVWTNGIPSALQLPAGYVLSSARSINDLGIVVGDARTAFNTAATTQVVWIDEEVFKINDLTTPGSPPIGNLLAVNEAGQLLQGGGARVLTPLSELPGDLNGDCAVDGADIAKLLAEWGPREWSVADIDGDGAVNGFDLGLLLGGWTGSK